WSVGRSGEWQATGRLFVVSKWVRVTVRYRSTGIRSLQMENIVNEPHCLLAIAVTDYAAYSNVGSRDHLYIDPRLSKLAEHGGRYIGLVHQSGSDDTHLCDILICQYS